MQKVFFNCLYYLFLLLILHSGCVKPEIIITREYIINGYWNEHAREIIIEKMKVKTDSVINYSRINVDLQLKLMVDSTFIYHAYVSVIKRAHSKTKIYFNKDNGFTWTKQNSNSSFKTIGDLEKNTWYKFSELVTFPYYVFVYIDSNGVVNRYNLNLSNY